MPAFFNALSKKLKSAKETLAKEETEDDKKQRDELELEIKERQEALKEMQEKRTAPREERPERERASTTMPTILPRMQPIMSTGRFEMPQVQYRPPMQQQTMMQQQIEQPRLIIQPPQIQTGPAVARRGPEVISEREVGFGERPLELEGEESGAGLKYKPISVEVPEEFEVAEGKGKSIAKEYIQKLKKIDDKFPLINLTVKGQKVTVSWGNIRWNDKVNSLVYSVYEPELTDKLRGVLDEAKTLLRQKLDIDFTKIRIEKAYEYLMQRLDVVLGEIAKDLDPKERVVLEYFVFRDFIGLAKIEPLLHDENLEDIHCDGFNIPLFVTHRNALYGELQTNLIFKTKEELDSFVLRLAQKCGKALSIAEPLMDGSLPDGSRVQVTYGTDIAMRGSNFTIRKFTEKPITPVDEINFGTSSPEICAYIWMAIEAGLSMLVAGPTATGKTSFLNAISMFIQPELKIISIEDTPELRLPHPNWIPEVARQGFGIQGYGEVTMFDLLKSALRQRPNFVIVGEVRGKEAYVMFQGMATGHPSVGTMHADSISSVIDRLTTEPINIPKPMLENLDLVLFLVQTKRKGEYVRRVNEIVEVIGYDPRSRSLITNRSFKWDSDNDRFILLKSVLLDKIREKMGYSIDDLKADMLRRIKLLRWLQKHDVTDYREVAKYFKLYHTNPEQIDKLVRRAE